MPTRFHPHRCQKNPAIGPRTPALQVLQVGMHALADAGVAAPSADLSEAGEAGPHRQPFGEFGNPATEPARVNRHLRPWPNQGHLAPDHVPQLRKLIEIEAAQPASQARARREVFIAPIVRLRLKIARSGSDFVQHERLAVESQPNVVKQHGPAIDHQLQSHHQQ